MSLVMAIISKDYLLLSGDERLTKGNKVIYEDVRKVTILNKNSIMGYAGEGTSCSKIVEYLQSLKLDNYSTEDFRKLISTKAKELYLLNKEKFSIIIAGNNNGNLKSYIISTCDGFDDLEIVIPSTDKPIFISFESGKSRYDASELFIDLCKNQVIDKQTAINILFNIHDCIAKDDYTVNMNLDFIYMDNKGNLESKIVRM